MNKDNSNNDIVERALNIKPLKTVIGPKGNYEVHTALLTWRSCCRVYHKGVKMDKFPAKCLDLNPTDQDNFQSYKERRSQLAKDITNIHFAMCKEVNQYLNQKNLRLKVMLSAFLVTFVLTCGYLITYQKNTASSSFTPNTQWKIATMTSHCKVGDPCVINLAHPENGVAKIPTEMTLVAADDMPAWLSFDPKIRQLNGMVPPNEPAGTYALSIRGMNSKGTGSLVRIEIIVESDSALATSQSFVEAGAETDKESISKLDVECLRNKLQGKPCI